MPLPARSLRTPPAISALAQTAASMARILSEGLIGGPEAWAAACQKAAALRGEISRGLKPLEETSSDEARLWRPAAQSLADAGERIYFLMDETTRWAAPSDVWAQRLCGRLSAAARELEKATAEGILSGAGAERLAGAVKEASGLQALFREARTDALDDPETVRGLRDFELRKRFSQAAASLVRAAQALAEIGAVGAHAPPRRTVHGA